MESRWDASKARAKNYAFREWTALAILAGYLYAFLYAPEWLVWWKRATTSTILSSLR